MADMVPAAFPTAEVAVDTVGVLGAAADLRGRERVLMVHPTTPRSTIKTPSPAGVVLGGSAPGRGGFYLCLYERSLTMRVRQERPTQELNRHA